MKTGFGDETQPAAFHLVCVGFEDFQLVGTQLHVEIIHSRIQCSPYNCFGDGRGGSNIQQEIHPLQGCAQFLRIGSIHPRGGNAPAGKDRIQRIRFRACFCQVPPRQDQLAAGLLQEMACQRFARQTVATEDENLLHGHGLFLYEPQG